MDIAANFDRGFQLEENRLIYENFSRPVAQLLNLIFRELHRLARLTTPDLQQPVNYTVYVKFGHV